MCAESVIYSSYIAVSIIGLIHGLEPGHGWPIAALLSLKRHNSMAYGFLSAVILSAAHFFSSIVVVIVYYIVAAFIDFTSRVFRYLVAAVLFALAIRFLTEKSSDEGYYNKLRGRDFNLRSIATFALILGFAHEEEFMLLALAIGGVNPLLLIITYASAVAASLIAITIIAIKAYNLVEKRINKIEHLIPKITGAILALLAFLFLIGVY